MRVDFLAVGSEAEQARIRFHPRLTVVGGLGVPERAQLSQLVLEALGGWKAQSGCARFVDDAGTGLVGRPGTDGWEWATDEGRRCASPIALLGLSVERLRALGVVGSAALGPAPGASGPGSKAELHDALVTLDAELDQARASAARIEPLRAELARIDDLIEKSASWDATPAGPPELSALVAELEQVRAEAAMIRIGGAVVADADHRLLAAAAHVADLTRRWRTAELAVSKERGRFGDRARLDPRTLNEALNTPSQVPPELDALAAEYEAAQAEVAVLDERLTALTTNVLGQPSNPTVVRLAHNDQDGLWQAAHDTITARDRQEQSSLSLGGIGANSGASDVAAHLDRAHEEAEAAERDLLARRHLAWAGAALGAAVAVAAAVTLPLLAGLAVGLWLIAAVVGVILPKRRVSAARSAEAAALSRAGAASYMEFQVRRVEVNVNPRATEPLELATFEHRRTMAAWRSLAGDIDPVDALRLEQETRLYAAALAGAARADDEMLEVQRRLSGVAAPALEQARQNLLTACAPFGIDEPALAVELVKAQASTNVVARAQAALERVEAAALRLRRSLDAELSTLGIPAVPAAGDGSEEHDQGDTDGAAARALEARLAAFEEARAATEQREQARCAPRSRDEVDADTARLEAEIAALKNGATSVPDLDSLTSARAALCAELLAAEHLAPEIDELETRRRGLLGRIAAIDAGGEAARAGHDRASASAVLHEALQRLSAGGSGGESVPLILDEAFVDLHGDDKRAVLDAVLEASEDVQIIYLTDDVDVLVWARNRKDSGAVSLLEASRNAA